MDADLVRLKFLLPETLRLGVVFGRHNPCLHACLLEVRPDWFVEITGPSRDLVFEQARRFLRVHSRGHGPMTFNSVVISPARICRGRDGWSITLGSSVTFSATPHVDADAAALPPG